MRAEHTGFTLLEVVVTLTVAAILGTMLAQFTGTLLTKSADPVLRVKKAYGANEIMESMSADYKRLMADPTASTPLATFKTHVQNGCTEGSSPYFGSCSVIFNNYVSFDASGSQTAYSGPAGQGRILKVTISQGDQRITALFTQ